MKYLIALILSATLASAYISQSDEVIVDGRIVHTTSRPLESYPWPKERPKLSEYADPGTSDAREVAAIWEISDGRLFLLAVSGYKYEPHAPARSLGLKDLMPERTKDAKVLADWFTGEFTLMAQERSVSIADEPIEPNDLKFDSKIDDVIGKETTSGTVSPTSSTLMPNGAPQLRFTLRKLRIVQGRVVEEGPTTAISAPDRR